MMSIDESLGNFKDTICDLIKSRKSISVTTHMDCDGLGSGGIMTKALIRAEASVTVRTAKEFSTGVVDEMDDDGRDFHIVTDLGGGFAEYMDKKLGDDWFILDHHQIADEEKENPRVINAWKYGMDGGVEICSGGMAFLAAQKLDKKNEDLAAMAVVTALGDRQDQGEEKSLVGRNGKIADIAKNEGLIEVKRDLLLTGRETRPLADALAFTSHPFMDGLTWNRDACHALVQRAGIKHKQDGRWRTAAELAEEEKRALVEEVIKQVGKSGGEITRELIGHTYTLTREDRRSILRDAREFSTMLNSSGRIGRSGVGIAVCMGDRNRMLRDAESILAEYKKMIRDQMNVIANERWRTTRAEGHVMVNGEGIVPETMSGTITSLIAGAPRNAGKIVILRTEGDEGTVKFSARKSLGCAPDPNLGEMMKGAAEGVGGAGGGHGGAAGARIVKDKLDEFLESVESNVSKGAHKTGQDV